MLTAEECKFEIHVDLHPDSGEGLTVPASLQAVRNGLFELRTACYLSPGARLQVKAKEFSFESRIVCCERQESGLFRLALILAGDEEKRSETRMAIEAAGVLRITNSLQTFAIRVVDISASGLGLDLPAPIPVGASVRVGLNVGTAIGEIRHCARKLDRYRAGMRLAEFIVHPNFRQTMLWSEDTSRNCAPVATLIRSIQERQSRYEAILFSLASSSEEYGRT